MARGLIGFILAVLVAAVAALGLTRRLSRFLHELETASPAGEVARAG